MRQYLATTGLLFLVASQSFAQFQENKGQSDSAYQYLVQVRGTLLRATKGGLEFKGPGASLGRLSLSNLEGQWVGEEPSTELISYQIGSDPKKWVQNVRSFQRLRRVNALPGVDWIVYFQNNKLEYDFELKRAESISRITVEWKGSSLDFVDGEVLTEFGGIQLRQRAPRFFGQERELMGQIEARSERSFGFRLNEAAPDGPLRIDPIVEIAGRIGGREDDQIIAANGILAIGMTKASTWDSAGEGSGWDIFVRSYRGGTRYSTVIWGGTGDEILYAGKSTGLAAEQNMVAVGSTTSRDLPSRRLLDGQIFLTASSNTPIVYGGGETDGLIVRANSSEISMSTLAGPNDEVFRAISSGNGETFFGGEVRSAQHPRGQGFISLNRSPELEQMLRFGNSGHTSIRALSWLSDNTQSSSSGIPSGVLYFAAETDSAGIEASTTWSKSSGANDVLIGAIRLSARDRLNPVVEWQGIWGGTANEEPIGMEAVSGQGLFLVGNTNSGDIEHRGAAQPSYGGGESDLFFLQLALNGNGILRSSYSGGDGKDVAQSARNFLGGILVAGSTDSTNWSFPGPPILPNPKPADEGLTDAFAALYSIRGSIDWGSRFGGPSEESASFIHANEEGIWLAGTSSDLSWLEGLKPVLAMPASGPGGAKDAFLVRFRTNLFGLGAIRVGQNLRADVNIAALLEPSSDGLLEVISTDPSRVLLTLPWSDQYSSADEPVARLAVPNLTSTTSTFRTIRFSVDAVGELGETELILRASGMPDRRFVVSVVPSAVYASEANVSQAVDSVLPYGAFFAPIAGEGETPIAQGLRYGFDPKLQFESSNPAALIPLGVKDFSTTPAPVVIWQDVELRERGSYELVPRSPFFATAPKQVTRVTDSVSGLSSLPQRPLVASQGLTWVYSIPGNRPAGPIEISSDNPDLILFSATNFETGKSSLRSSESFIFCQTLGGSGRVNIMLTGANGWNHRQEVQLVRTRVRLNQQVNPAIVGETVALSATFSPDSAAFTEQMAPAERFQPVQLAQFSVVPLMTNQIAINPTSAAQAQATNTSYFQGAFQTNFTVLASGSIGFTLRIPEFLILDGVASTTVQVRVPSLRSPDAEILLPQGCRRRLSLVADIPRALLSNISVTFKDAGVAAVRQNGFLESTRINLGGFDNTVFVAALGRPGARTTVTFTAGDFRLEIPIRIVPFQLVNRNEESRIEVEGPILFAVTGREGDKLLNPDDFELSELTSFSATASAAGVCDVPTTVNLGPFGSGFRVNCPASGLVDITLRPPNSFTDGGGATFRIRSGENPLNVILRGATGIADTPERIILGASLQTAVDLGFQTLSSNEWVITSLNPDLVRVSNSGDRTGAESIRSTAEFGRRAPVYLQASNRVGATTLRFVASDGRSKEVPIFVWPSSVVFNPNTFGARRNPSYAAVFTPGTTQPIDFPLTLTAVDPLTQIPYTQINSNYRYSLVPGRTPSLLRVTSSNRAVLDPLLPTPVFGGDPGLLRFRANLVSSGSSILEVEQPEGFSASVQSRMLVESRPARIVLNGPLLLAAGAQRAFSLSLSPQSFSEFIQYTVISTNPDAIQLSVTETGPAASQVTIGRGSQFYVRCLKEDPAALRVEAAGFATETLPVRYGALRLAKRFTQLKTNPGQTLFLSFTVEFVSAADRAQPGRMLPNPDANYRFAIRSSDDSILSFPDEMMLRQSPGSFEFTSQIRALKPGEARLSIEVLGRSIQVSEPWDLLVEPWRLDVPDRLTVGRGLVSQYTIRNNRQEPLRYRIEARGGAAIGTQISSLGTNAVEVEVPRSGGFDLYVAMPLNPLSASLVWSAPDSLNAETTINGVPARFSFNGTLGTNLVIPLSRGSLEIPIDVSADGVFVPTTLSPLLGSQELRLTSSNPLVASFDSNTLLFPAGYSQRNATLRLRSAGTVIITLEAPSAFNPTGQKQELVITVR